MEFGHHAVVIDDVAVVLAGVQAVHASDGLEKRVAGEAAGDIEHHVPRRVESGEQLVHHDEDFRLISSFECIDNPPVVFLFGAVFGHHRLPEDLHALILFRLRVLLRVLNFGGAGDDDLRAHLAELVKKAFEHQCLFLAGGGELAFESGPLPLLGKMLGHIPGDQVKAALETVELVTGAEFPLQVGLLFGGQPLAHGLEHGIHRLLVDLLNDVPPLVEQRPHSPIGDGLPDGVGRFDEPAELRGRALFDLHERRAGETDIAGIRQSLLHLDIRFAVLAAVAFIHQNKNIVLEPPEFLGGLRGGFEFEEYRCNH